MATYTPCAGWKQEPQKVYKPVRHRILYDGRKHRDAGYGLCRSCLRVTSVLNDKNGRMYIGRHSPKRQSFDTRKKAHWEAYEQLGVGAPRITNNYIRQAGGMAGHYVASQSITMTGNATYIPYGADRMQYVPMTQQMYLELTSDTQNAQGQYVFNINGLTYVSPERRMTLVTDHAVWNQWANSITVSANTTYANQGVWNNWTGAIGNYGGNLIANQVYPAVPQRRPAYDRVARAEELFRRVESERAYKAEAALKAHETLMGLLTEEQAAEYRERNFFHVRGSRGRLYRIRHGSSGNIRRVRSVDDGDREEAAFCVHSVTHTDARTAEEVGLVSGHLPHEDHMIQQMLHLMIDEDEILSKANVHWGTREPGADYEVRESGLLVAAGR